MTNYIEIADLSKKYLISREQAAYSTLRESLSSHVKAVINKFISPFSVAPPSRLLEFWALKEINLAIKEGESVGIIGSNGAGKSTLLKILSKITGPTSGTLKMRGKVSSLLEVGTGFHPELTGKENIFLNGAILGMKHQEIRLKFDAIVDFAEVEKFLDTPVKRYSSGMLARLGFAIAAHMEPDILIVDEVLAVGDAAFQKKCLKTLTALGDMGRTVLFVSHDINAVMSLCSRGVYLEKGKVVFDGPIDQCVDEYMRHIRSNSVLWTGNLGSEQMRFQRMHVRSDKGSAEYVYQNENASVDIDFEVHDCSKDIVINISAWNLKNQKLAQSCPFKFFEGAQKIFSNGFHRISFKLPAGLFYEGEYIIKLDCSYQGRKIIEDDIAVKFSVHSSSGLLRAGPAHEFSGLSLGSSWEVI